MSFNEMPTVEAPINNQPEKTAVFKEQIDNNEDYLNKAVTKIQEIFINSAKKYLDKEGDKYLKEQIIKFYSDESRLKTELAHVFSGLSEEDVYQKIAETAKSIENKEAFINYVETKNFATSLEERAVEEARIQNIYKLRDQKQLETVRNEISEIDSQNLESAGEWKGTQFWTKEIEAAGLSKKIKFFNDVVTEKTAPHQESGYGEPILKDVTLDGKKVDIYHSDNKAGQTMNRLFLHIKE